MDKYIQVFFFPQEYVLEAISVHSSSVIWQKPEKNLFDIRLELLLPDFRLNLSHVKSQRLRVDV